MSTDRIIESISKDKVDNSENVPAIIFQLFQVAPLSIFSVFTLLELSSLEIRKIPSAHVIHTSAKQERMTTVAKCAKLKSLLQCE